MQVQQFRIGDVALDPKKVNAGTIETLGKKAKELGDVEGAEDTVKLLRSWYKTGQMSEQDQKALRKFGSAAYKVKADLTDQWWKLGGPKGDSPEKAAIEARLVPLNVFLYTEHGVGDALREAKMTATIAALAGGNFGPIGVVAAYAAWNDIKEDKAREVLDNLTGLKSGQHHMVVGGNKVEQVHQEKLWPAIINLLDEGIESAKKGKPVEVDAQYYELTSADVLGKMREVAEAGAPLRVNVDPALRLSYPDSKGQFDIDDVPHKFRSILQLTQLAQQEHLNVAVSMYPVSKQLEDPTDLMHRKVLRVGDKVLLSGMNANLGSGENIDAGYVVEGPAAKRLVENLKRDCEQSKGVSNEEIFGQDYWKKCGESAMVMGTRGVSALLDCLSGVQPAGEEIKPVKSWPELHDRATAAGVDLNKFFDVPEEQFLQKMQDFLNGEKLPLSEHGKETCSKLFTMTMDAVNNAGNQKRIADIKPPAGNPAGKTVMAIADLPSEREAMAIHCIQQAEEFVYIPGFVVTRGIAAAIAARKEELEAQGKQLEVCVIADPGVYPRGDTPNSWGVKFLEDKGITPRWALLPRSGWHDRKIHAKQLITDKHEMFGSTNFSKKGMQENWETSGMVTFDPKDAESMKNREESIRGFKHLWEHESFECSSLELAGRWKSKVKTEDKQAQIEDARNSAIKKIIQQIEVVEEESARWMGQKAADPKVAGHIQDLMKSGVAEGYAICSAVKESMGEEKYYAELAKLPERQKLERMRPSGGSHEE